MQNGQQNITTTTRRQQITAVLASPILWMIYFVLIYALDEAVCQLEYLGSSVIMTIMVISTVLMMGVTAFFGYHSWTLYQNSIKRSGINQEQQQFMGYAGLLMNGFSMLLTLGLAVILWTLPLCG